MLTELYIRNFALIDELRLDLSTGFTALTGETGAGKSIIVDAVATVLGERTGPDVIRTGADKCVIQAVFDLTGLEKIANIAAERGCAPEDGLLILTREIAREGRSQCRVNGRVVPASVVREITSQLVDLHGQHEHQSLLTASTHLDILDSWVGSEAMSTRAQVRALWEEFEALQLEVEQLRANERDRARMLDLYKYQLDEIRSADLKPGEEEELLAERNLLANSEKLLQACAEIYRLLGADGSAVDCLSEAASIAEKVAAIDPSFSGVVENLQTALAAAQEAVLVVRDYQDRVEADPARLEQVEDRLDLIRRLKRKYGDTIEDILRYYSELSTKLDELDKTEERLAEVEKEIESVRSRLVETCSKLSSLRKNGASEFERQVEKELADLAMERARFEVSIGAGEPGPSGADRVEFLISTNPGEPVKPLARIASGGEISRVMLALKTVTKGSDIPVLVFDEIDVGIGGMTAQILGARLASLASQCQVLCVTHLPQVASRADQQIAVDKTLVKGRTVVRARKLEGEERVIEIARMLGADTESEVAMTHAREMLAAGVASKTALNAGSENKSITKQAENTRRT